jgi:hypothetical protein
VCTFFSFSLSLSQELRGQGADGLILEEAAFISPNIFKNAVVPLIGVKNTAVLGISTPQDELNYYNQLMESGFFKCIKIGLSCDDCLSKGIKCPHKRERLPAWKPEEKQELIENFYGSGSAGTKQMQRELYGQVASSKIFTLQHLSNKLATLPRIKIEKPVEVMHVGIDPGTGGEGSDYAMVSMVYYQGFYVVRTTFTDVNSNTVSLQYKHRDEISTSLSLLLFVDVIPICTS